MNANLPKNTSPRGTLIALARIAGSVLVIALMTTTTTADQPRTGGTPSQPPGSNAPATVEQYYPVDSGVHWIGIVLDRGAKVKLEDGSIWEIADKDQFHTRDWRVAQKITVSRNPNDRYPFKLTNTDQKSPADARLASRPK